MTAGNEVSQTKMPAMSIADEAGFGISLRSALDADEGATTTAGDAQAGTTQTGLTKIGASPKNLVERKPASRTDASATVDLLLSVPLPPQAQQTPSWQVPSLTVTDGHSLNASTVLSTDQSEPAQVSGAAVTVSSRPPALATPFPLTSADEQILPGTDKPGGDELVGTNENTSLPATGDEGTTAPEPAVASESSTAPQDAPLKAGVPAHLFADAALEPVSAFTLKEPSGVSLPPQTKKAPPPATDSGAGTASSSASRLPSVSSAAQAPTPASQAAFSAPLLPSAFSVQDVAPAISAIDEKSLRLTSATPLRQAGNAGRAVQTDDDDPVPAVPADSGSLSMDGTTAAFAALGALKDKVAEEKGGVRTSALDALPAMLTAQPATSGVQAQSLPLTKNSTHQGVAANSTEAGDTKLQGMASPTLQRMLQHSEMQVHIDAAEFGQVSVHARYDQGGIAAHIRLEDTSMATALGSALSANANHLEQRLQGGLGTSASVSVSTGAGSSSHGGGEAQSDARTKAQVPGVTSLRSVLTTYPADVTQPSSLTANSGESAGRRVDIRI